MTSSPPVFIVAEPTGMAPAETSVPLNNVAASAAALAILPTVYMLLPSCSLPHDLSFLTSAPEARPT
jgi:hypothetical protein